MTNLTERVAKAIARAELSTAPWPEDELDLHMPSAQAALTEIFNYLENPSEAVITAGHYAYDAHYGYCLTTDDMRLAFIAMLIKSKEAALSSDEGIAP